MPRGHGRRVAPAVMSVLVLLGACGSESPDEVAASDSAPEAGRTELEPVELSQRNVASVVEFVRLNSPAAGAPVSDGQPVTQPPSYPLAVRLNHAGSSDSAQLSIGVVVSARAEEAVTADGERIPFARIRLELRNSEGDVRDASLIWAIGDARVVGESMEAAAEAAHLLPVGTTIVFVPGADCAIEPGNLAFAASSREQLVEVATGLESDRLADFSADALANRPRQAVERNACAARFGW